MNVKLKLFKNLDANVQIYKTKGRVNKELDKGNMNMHWLKIWILYFFKNLISCHRSAKGKADKWERLFCKASPWTLVQDFCHPSKRYTIALRSNSNHGIANSLVFCLVLVRPFHADGYANILQDLFSTLYRFWIPFTQRMMKKAVKNMIANKAMLL